MLIVILALVPAILTSCYFYSAALLIQLLMAVSTAVLVEACILCFKKTATLATLEDLSAVLSAILIALSVPAFSPWWLTLTACLVGIGIAKHGLTHKGQNIFNPAMAAYLFLLLLFPQQMNSWPAANSDQNTPYLEQTQFQYAVDQIFSNPLLETAALQAAEQLDGHTSATPLNQLKAAPYKQPGHAPMDKKHTTNEWLWINLSGLLGGILLLLTKRIQLQIPLAFIGTLAACHLIEQIFYQQIDLQLLFQQLLSGGTMLAAFFILTEPVTAPRKTYHLCYASLIAIAIYCIRGWTSLTDGIAICVIAANVITLLLNHAQQLCSPQSGHALTYIKSNKKRCAFNTLLMGVFCIPLIAISANQFKPDHSQLKLKQSISQILAVQDPSSLTLTCMQSSDETGAIKFYLYQNNNNRAFFYPISAPNAYNEDIQIILGLTEQGKVLGARILFHNETPGIGDKIEIEKTDWITQFNGKQYQTAYAFHWALKTAGGMFDAFTGATITPMAVINAIKKQLQWHQMHYKTLLNPIVCATKPK